MRIEELDLVAYGGFSGLRLDLSRSGALQIVFGANEAGKSTTLRAVHALLYGIEQRTSDDYVHAYGDLRIGARVTTRDGRELSFVRRKGSKLLAAVDFARIGAACPAIRREGSVTAF